MTSSPATGKADRAYLEGLVESYIRAMVERDPGIAPLSDKVKYTENTIQLEIGDGLWATASALPTYRLYACDPETGQPIILSCRVKAEKGLITEIESIVVRSGERPIPTENLIKPKQVYLEALEPSERVSREEMVRITNLYFDALEQDDGDIVPWDERCNRVENGTQTTNNPNINTGNPKFNPLALGCREQISSKSFVHITEIRPRYCSVIDEERGLTFGTYVFHHKGNITSVDIPGIGKVELTPDAIRPFTVVVHEIFKIQSGKIREIEAMMTVIPYRAGSGWDD